MAKITLMGSEANTKGSLPKIGIEAHDFKVVNTNLEERALKMLKGSRVVLNIFPSIDTGVCATSVRKFNEKASSLENTKVWCISKDLPFALSRFCGAEGIKNVETLSDFRGDFSGKYEVEMVDTPMRGLLSRCIIVVDENSNVIYTEQVGEIGNEPNYEKVIEILSK